LIKKRSKYNVDVSDLGKAKRTYNNIIFDSVVEKNYYIYLLNLQTEGKVESIELQPKYKLFDGILGNMTGGKYFPSFIFLIS